MNDERPLAEGWVKGVGFIPDPENVDLYHNLSVVLARRGMGALIADLVYQSGGGPVYGINETPDSCFADPAPPPDEALKAGERAWVSNPQGLHDAPRIDGWGTIKDASCQNGPGYEVVLDVPVPTSAGGVNAVWYILPPACHREGPSGPPPAAGAVFLGRDPLPSYRDGKKGDCWWVDGAVQVAVTAGCGWARFKPATIDSDGENALIPILAVARALGLVEAEPERPEPKFVVGQWVEAGRDTVRRITRVEWIRNPAPGDVSYWRYQCNAEWYSEAYLKPHTMTIADVPAEVLVAIARGKPVRVVDVPVHDRGIPVDVRWLVYRLRGSTLVPLNIHDIGTDDVTVEFTAGSLRPWNLALAPDA